MSPVRQSSRAYHRVQVARAARYLRDHATEQLSLAEVARAAGAAPYHFARLYHAATGETVFATLTRLRLALGAEQLGAEPTQPIARIALAVGYATPSSFNKAFRAELGSSPTEFRARSARWRLGRVAELRRPPRAPDAPPVRLSGPVHRQCGPLRVAYVREQGDYDTIAAPLAWARLDACLDDTYARCVRIAATHDDPRVVMSEALRYDAGIVVDDGMAPPRGTSLATWPGGSYAVFTHRGPYRLIAAAFAAIVRGWIATERPRLRDAPFLELYRNSPADIAEDDLVTELWVPVEQPA